MSHKDLPTSALEYMREHEEMRATVVRLEAEIKVWEENKVQW